MATFKNLLFISTFSLASCHIALVSPPPRNSKDLPGVDHDSIDYSMTAPLDASRPFPCLGHGPGPSAGKYSAGQMINTKLGGEANHNGGHCQFGLSYDGQTFVAIKTILGDCLVSNKEYQVKIPDEAPSGRAVFMWSWVNRSGNREYYANCADIDIEGKQSGSITGNEILVGNFEAPGKKNYKFPEGFSNEFGADYFKQTPVVTVSPNGNQQTSPSYDAKPIGDSGYEVKPPKPDTGYQVDPPKPVDPVSPPPTTYEPEPPKPVDPVSPPPPTTDSYQTTEPPKPVVDPIPPPPTTYEPEPPKPVDPITPPPTTPRKCHRKPKSLKY